MKHLTIPMAVAVVVLLASPVQAGPIRRACLAADLDAATRSLCTCIERVAKPMFSRSEMRRIAKFFKEPHLSQKLRQSDRRADERLWERYQAWGEAARAQCE